MASANLRALWDEPAAPDPPTRVWRDWVLVGGLLVVAALEGGLRADLVWRPLAIALAVVAIVALLWRRAHPLPVVLVSFGSMFVVTATGMLLGTQSVGLYSAACVLLLPYSLTRWGSGRAIVAGLAVIVTVGALGVASSYTAPVDAIAATVFLLFPAVLGASVRYWDTAHERDVERARLREREQLARELHDTVAHHVSAMAIQAQAGRVLADTRPEAAVSALRVIEIEASRALAEMRTMVGALRDGEAAELAPQRGVSDIARLADVPAGDARVDVELSGDLDELGPAVQSALYRMAQESLTNAVRHARRATRIGVRIVGDVDCVHLTVSDDGEPSPAGRSAYGYGLVGMKERATLLGGTFTAGPSAPRGWTVDAVLPRRTAAR
jgi:signal transduction histidine kinase